MQEADAHLQIISSFHRGINAAQYEFPVQKAWTSAANSSALLLPSLSRLTQVQAPIVLKTSYTLIQLLASRFHTPRTASYFQILTSHSFKTIMRFAVLIALAIVASTVPSLAAPTPYSSRRVTSERHTASTDNNTVVGTSVRNGCVPLRFGRVILPGDNLSLDSKRDTTSDIVQAIEAVLNELPPARKRDITADITAALQTLLQESGSVLNDVKRDLASSDVENRRVKAPKVKPSVSTWLDGASNVVSIGSGIADIWSLVDSGNSARRDLEQTFDEVNAAGTLNGAALQFEDRSFKSHPSAGSILKDGADIVGAAAAAASFISAINGSGNSTKRDLGMDSGRISDQRRAVVSDIESILQLIISSFEGVGSTSTSTSTSIKRSTNNDGFLGLTDIITPEQLDELS